MTEEVIKFGSYYQSSLEYKEPIEWIVLTICGSKKLLLSKYVLKCLPYHEKLTAITWEHSSLRNWLNNDFINEAFNEEEAKHIITCKNKNFDNPDSNSNGGNKTYDKVFLLSVEEVKKYLTDYQCESTYLVAIDENKYSFWWLRSVGNTQGSAFNVYRDGRLGQRSVHCSYYGVRPAIWLDTENEDTLLLDEKKYLYLGHYYQENNQIKTSIKWRVIDEDDNQMLLVSETGLEYLSFDDNCNPNFSESSIRDWLNTKFIDVAFDELEKNALIDEIRLLTFDEALYLFDDRNDRKIGVNEYLLSLNPNLSRFPHYWLGTSGVGDCVMMINGDGSINKGGILARFSNIIRPTIRVIKKNYEI